MKLRNKQTGEIGTFVVGADTHEVALGVLINGETEFFNTLAELNAEWEDVTEEPKGYYYINTHLHSVDYVDNTYENKGKDQEIGNVFETEEEAEKAVEKLKAWKRLKDKSFRFNGWIREHKKGSADITIASFIDEDYDITNDLDLLFGGEE